MEQSRKFKPPFKDWFDAMCSGIWAMPKPPFYVTSTLYKKTILVESITKGWMFIYVEDGKTYYHTVEDTDVNTVREAPPRKLTVTYRICKESELESPFVPESGIKPMITNSIIAEYQYSR